MSKAGESGVSGVRVWGGEGWVSAASKRVE